MRIARVLTTVCLLSSFLSAENALQSAAISQWQNRVFTLRSWFGGAQIQTDDQGNLLRGGPSVSWTVSRFQVESVRFTHDKIELRGNRIGLFYDTNHQQLVNVRVAPLLLTVRADTTKLQPSDLDRIANAIFLTDGAQLTAALPYFWKAWAIGGIKAVDNPKGKGQFYFLPNGPNAVRGVPPKLEAIATTATGEQIFRVAPGITPPKVLKAIDPSYDDFARSLRVQGKTVLAVVINAEGDVGDVQVARPLGMGLDERAVEAVRSWRFRPAMKDGQPVAVQVDVEVSFRLY